jgi:prepilin-type N-terminal cleavage/methylation domain-containing protein
MRRQGFTLIEVVIASAIFATVAVVGTAILAGTYKAQKQIGIIQTRQETVRSVFEAISREVRFSKGITIAPVPGSSTNILTITEADNTTKSYQLGKDSAGLGTLYQVTTNPDGSLKQTALNADTTNVTDFTVSGISTTFDTQGKPAGQVSYVKLDMTVLPTDISNGDQPFESEVIVSPRGYYVNNTTPNQ